MRSLIKVNDVRNKSARSVGRILININEVAAETLKIYPEDLFSLIAVGVIKKMG